MRCGRQRRLRRNSGDLRKLVSSSLNLAWDKKGNVGGNVKPCQVLGFLGSITRIAVISLPLRALRLFLPRILENSIFFPLFCSSCSCLQFLEPFRTRFFCFVVSVHKPDPGFVFLVVNLRDCQPVSDAIYGDDVEQSQFEINTIRKSSFPYQSALQLNGGISTVSYDCI